MSDHFDSYGRMLSDPANWRQSLIHVLEPQVHRLLDDKGPPQPSDSKASSVLLLLAPTSPHPGAPAETSLILTKRSRMVRQAGDLCCPGGITAPRLDAVLANLLLLPCSPLSRWPFWAALHRHTPAQSRKLAFLLATGLRESWEEIRLNPTRVLFLGALPKQRLLLFPRSIHPLVVWVERQRRFFPSWEVDRIVSIPVRRLLDPNNHYRYRLYVAPHLADLYQPDIQDFPCVFHRDHHHAEVLWGVTYRIVMEFLDLVFGFRPPDVTNRPFIPGLLDESYLNGRD